MLSQLSRSQKQSITKLLKISLLVAIVGIGIYFLTQPEPNASPAVSGATDQAQISEPLASATIDRSFQVPLVDEAGEEIAQLKYVIESAERRDEILVKGQKATAVDGRQFLILNLKIVNDSEQGITVNTRNYIRLSANGNQDEWMAPDIHNDPVEVQAISTKKTRIGFPINASDSNFLLQFGEIEGEKEIIELNI